MEGTRPGPKVEHPRCPYCRGPVRPDEAKQACDACMTWHHRDCWDEHGERCSTCGAQRAVGTDDAEPSASSPRDLLVRAGPPDTTHGEASARPPPARSPEPVETGSGSVLLIVSLALLGLSPIWLGLLIALIERLVG